MYSRLWIRYFLQYSVVKRTMNIMTDIMMSISNTVSPLAPTCQQCGAPTRLFGIEPHPSFSRTDIRTYACDACEGVEVIHVPLPALNV